METDVVECITIRYNSGLHHIGLGKRRTGTNVTVLINDRHIRVLSFRGPVGQPKGHRHGGQS
jgi:hypothetical protein